MECAGATDSHCTRYLTASLDVDSIEKFQSVVRRLAKDEICIFVTHDMSTMTICDKMGVRVGEQQSSGALPV